MRLRIELQDLYDDGLVVTPGPIMPDRIWQLAEAYDTAVAAALASAASDDARISKSTTRVHTFAHDLVIRAIDASILPVTQVPAVLSEWRTPAHEEFVADGRTAWRLFNAFTET